VASYKDSTGTSREWGRVLTLKPGQFLDRWDLSSGWWGFKFSKHSVQVHSLSHSTAASRLSSLWKQYFTLLSVYSLCSLSNLNKEACRWKSFNGAVEKPPSVPSHSGSTRQTKPSRACYTEGPELKVPTRSWITWMILPTLQHWQGSLPWFLQRWVSYYHDRFRLPVSNLR
jgi:hypothetical protein